MVTSQPRQLWLSLLTLLISLLSLPSSLWAQIEVSAPQTVEQGTPFNVSYTIRNVEIQGDFGAPAISAGLECLYGPAISQGSSVQIINGKRSSSSELTFTYTYLASSTGQVNLKGAHALIGGKKVVARDISIKVLPQSKTSAAGSSRNAPTGKYLYRTIASQRSVYEKELFPVSYKLYASRGFDIEDAKAPAYDGFLSQNLKPQGPTQLQQEHFEGVNYQTAVIYNDALAAQKSGKLTIPSSQIVLRLPLPLSDDPFDVTFVNKTLTSDPITIDVKPLPSEGKPQDFSGAVGSFSATSKLSSNTGKTGEALRLTLTISGEGNIRQASLPNPVLPESFEVYSPQDSTQQHIEGSRISTTRSVEYSFIPREVGSYTIPAISFSFFNPKTHSYQTASTPPLRVEITKGKDATRTLKPSEREQREQGGIRALQPVTHRQDLRRQIAAIAGGVYPLLYLILLSLGVALYRYLRHIQTLRADEVRYRSSKSGSLANKRLRRAQELLSQGVEEAFYAELVDALYGYLSDRLTLPLSDFSRESLKELLLSRGAPEHLADRAIELLNAIDYARYAPGSARDKMQDLYAQVSDLIASIQDDKSLH